MASGDLITFRIRPESSSRSERVNLNYSTESVNITVVKLPALKPDARTDKIVGIQDSMFVKNKKF